MSSLVSALGSEKSFRHLKNGCRVSADWFLLFQDPRRRPQEQYMHTLYIHQAVGNVLAFCLQKSCGKAFIGADWTVRREETRIDYSDIPELDDSFWNNAKIEYPENKKPVTLRLDRDVLDWFKSTGKGYQTRINAILRSYVEAPGKTFLKI